MTPNPDRRDEILRALASIKQGDLLERLCLLAVARIPCDGVAVVVSAQGVPAGVLASAGECARTLTEAEFDLGEGPAFESTITDRPVLIDHLDITTTQAWPFVGSRLARAGIAAVSTFPLRLGAIRLGVAHVIRLAPGALSDDAFANARVLADRRRALLAGRPGQRRLR
ncbi:MAG: GAF domain-containing protein [Candidatus Nanopelagicales bacterium]